MKVGLDVRKRRVEAPSTHPAVPRQASCDCGHRRRKRGVVTTIDVENTIGATRAAAKTRPTRYATAAPGSGCSRPPTRAPSHIQAVRTLEECIHILAVMNHAVWGLWVGGDVPSPRTPLASAPRASPRAICTSDTHTSGYGSMNVMRRGRPGNRASGRTVGARERAARDELALPL